MMSGYFCFRDKKLSLSGKTNIMGILNVTPDSFSDGGKNFSLKDSVSAAILMENDGADIIDIGGQSTRPGATPISEEEEWDRIKDIIPAVLSSVNTPVSVDTFYPSVAEKALALGCHIINDVSGNVSPEMAKVVSYFGAGWCLMHNKKEETSDISATVHINLLDMLQKAMSLGIKRENICLDAGIGFSKTREQDKVLINETEKVRVEGNAYLLGLSRKRVIGEALCRETAPEERDFGTIAANIIGVIGGANILRVHNVAATRDALKVADFLLAKEI